MEGSDLASDENNEGNVGVDGSGEDDVEADSEDSGSDVVVDTDED
jgi:hypothetical protein